jgi:mono/diheme cytochrome c family protein
VSFARDIFPIFDQTCLKCHGGDKTEKGLSVKTYAALMQGSQRGAVIVPGDPGSSRLVQLLQSGKMPKRAPRLSETEIELVMEWIRAGAQNN